MNAKEDSYAVLKRSFCGNEGKKVHVLFQEGVDPVFGLTWRVRFEHPVLVALSSPEDGKFLPGSLVLSDIAVVPDAWLMAIDLEPHDDLDAGKLLHPADQMAWLAYAAPMEMDLVKPEDPPESLDADLTWPDGWLKK